MGKLSSKLCKNENKSEISLFQIYLPKLHENMCYNQTGDISTLDGTSLKLVDKFI